MTVFEIDQTPELGFDRAAFFSYLSRRANHLGLVRLKEIDLAEQLDCHRATIINLLNDLQAAGRVRRFCRAGPKGLVIQILR